MTVFVDTRYFVAIMAPRDQWHKKAVRAYRPRLNLATSAAVINETISLLHSRGLLSAALAFLADVRANPDIEVFHTDAILQSEAWNLFHRFAGSGANAMDCVSFAIMKKLSINRALTFDEHFRAAGFEILG